MWRSNDVVLPSGRRPAQYPDSSNGNGYAGIGYGRFTSGVYANFMGMVGCPAPTELTLQSEGPTVSRVLSAFIRFNQASDFGCSGNPSMRTWKIELAGP